jgi:NADH dehydrogenase
MTTHSGPPATGMRSVTGRPRLVIVGGGFAGLTLARALARDDLDITLVDRSNHHTFQPLLYQVATASLSPADIAAPIRKILSRQANCRVIMGRAERVDMNARRVVLADGSLEYDLLALCCGVSHSYFGKDEWGPSAPGLKTIDDALEIRRRFLLAFEAAERETDQHQRQARLTFVIVGGGPTGVELAGAMAEVAHRAIPRDFRAVDTTTARILLVHAGERLLEALHPTLSARALSDLRGMGVEVVLGSRVTHVDDDGVMIGERRIWAENVLWAAGVRGQAIADTLGAAQDRAGRVVVGPDLSIPGRPEVLVLGDLAGVTDPRTQRPVPGVAPAANQMGRYGARVIRRRAIALAGGHDPAALPPEPPFTYVDKGTLATIGRLRAVGEVRGLRFAGVPAWLLWALVHVLFLVSFRNRVLVMLHWAWEFVLFAKGARLITGPSDLDLGASQGLASAGGVGGARDVASAAGETNDKAPAR